jgi:hypothetical protein
LLKYKEYFQVQPDKKIKWLGNFDELKCLIFDLFSVDGKWSSPLVLLMVLLTAFPVNNHQVCVPKESSSKTAVFCSPSLNNQPAVADTNYCATEEKEISYYNTCSQLQGINPTKTVAKRPSFS